MHCRVVSALRQQVLEGPGSSKRLHDPLQQLCHCLYCTGPAPFSFSAHSTVHPDVTKRSIIQLSV